MSSNEVKKSNGHVRVHSVLYMNDPRRISRTVAHLNRAADLAIASKAFDAVTLVYGDSSPVRSLSEGDLDAIRRTNSAFKSIEYIYFDANLGSAKGHNTLIEDVERSNTENAPIEHVLIMNPDVMLAPDALIELARPLVNPRVGLIEARQLPIEHPKEYNRVTGETDWATTACALIPLKILRQMNGFDYESFFLYCDDVDFSWRARLAGYSIIYQPSAAVFHDKRLGAGGRWAPANSEKYYSAEAALMMAHKYSRPDIVRNLLSSFSESPVLHLRNAAIEYQRRASEGRLPTPIDSEGKVATFDGDFYTKHRFNL